MFYKQCLSIFFNAVSNTLHKAEVILSHRFFLKTLLLKNWSVLKDGNFSTEHGHMEIDEIEYLLFFRNSCVILDIFKSSLKDNIRRHFTKLSLYIYGCDEDN